jgi:hypothetical protein
VCCAGLHHLLPAVRSAGALSLWDYNLHGSCSCMVFFSPRLNLDLLISCTELDQCPASFTLSLVL